MRKNYKKQLSLLEKTPVHPKVLELEKISKILDQNHSIYDIVLQDLSPNVKKTGNGANGMTAEQVVRAAIIKQMEGYSYEELAFHIADSRSYMSFCKIGFADKVFKKSALSKNIKGVSPETWEKINKIVIAYAEAEKIEKGKKVRIDCSVVSSDIHKPTDSSLLWDTVRVLDRLMKKGKEEISGIKFPYQDHTKRAKRRMLNIMNTSSKKTQTKKYKDLLKVTNKVIGYAKAAVRELKAVVSVDRLSAQRLAKELEHYIGLAEQVKNQTEQRIIHGEIVSAAEKIFSIFETHTDIIKKDRRDTYYGHKVCLTGGSSNLILDCTVLEGNPADSTLTDQMFDRQKDIYGRYPLKASLDGGFTSKANLESAKTKGIKDVCFAKKRGLDEEDMCRSRWVYKKLRNFRAGIESGISWLKRSFGFGRCLWKGFSSFKSYVWSAIVSANLLTIARKQLA